MRRVRARIEHLTTRPAGRPSFRILAPEGAIPAAGQAALALRPERQEVLRTPLFPSAISRDGFSAVIPEGCDWNLGDELDLAGPIGNGFSPPPRSRRWLLASFDQPPDRLLPLIVDGVTRGLELALICTHPPPELPEVVELNPAWPEAAQWADFTALDLGAGPPVGTDWAERRRDIRGSGTAQILITPAMPCGLGACGACAFRTRRGSILACQDGMVQDIRDLTG
jgi:hypothetical protein